MMSVGSISTFIAALAVLNPLAVRAVFVANEFVECADGTQAVAVYGQERPDWAVVDVAMKTMDGLAATRLITSNFPGSHILVVTQHNHPKLRERAREAGAENLLLKEDLIQLRSLLSTGAQPGENTRNDPTTPLN